MAFSFDTLGYAKRLEDAGIPREQAEAHATGAREFVVNEVVTKEDLRLGMDNLRLAINARLEHVERQILQQTVRLGSLVTVGVAILAAIIKLT